MRGVEKRIGRQRAVIADVRQSRGMFRTVSLHLDAHSSQRHRHLQMRRLLDHLETLTPQLPTLIGGDWNTTTHDASRALYSIVGYWRRVLMVFDMLSPIITLSGTMVRAQTLSRIGTPGLRIQTIEYTGRMHLALRRPRYRRKSEYGGMGATVVLLVYQLGAPTHRWRLLDEIGLVCLPARRVTSVNPVEALRAE